MYVFLKCWLNDFEKKNDRQLCHFLHINVIIFFSAIFRADRFGPTHELPEFFRVAPAVANQISRVLTIFDAFKSFNIVHRLVRLTQTLKYGFAIT